MTSALASIGAFRHDPNILQGATAQKPKEDERSRTFLDHLKEGIAEVNEAQVAAEKMASSVAVGKTENLHETMVALSQAELSFNLMVQVRNRALEAYQEVMRMQV